MNPRVIGDLDVAGKRLVVRADLNVPMRAGRITDASRITRFAAGMKPLLARGARLIILTHFGRPQPGSPTPDFSTRVLVPALADALGLAHMDFAACCIGAATRGQSRDLAPGAAMLCENLRFHPGESANDHVFAAELATLGDVYVNDAFSCAHRAHASTDALAHLLPSAAGPLFAEEADALTRALETPQRPAIAVVGGAKISSKIGILKNLVTQLDAIIIGGAMANTFLCADGAPMGRSLYEPDHLDDARCVVSLAALSGCEIALPTDVVCAEAMETGTNTVLVDAHDCPPDMMILDAGPRSVARFKDVLCSARTTVWNGPLGAFEVAPFDAATVSVARFAADLTARGRSATIAGGGDTVAALNAAGVGAAFSYVSTAGGAFLAWLEGKTLPGLAALQQF